MATNDCPSTTGRLFVTDRTSKTQFLVDTGSDICVFPKSATRMGRPKTDHVLYAANGSPISTYGFTNLILNLGLRREFSWRFVVADVTKAIIGVDFLSHFGLVVDFRNQRLVDNVTSLTTTAISALSSDTISSVKTLTGDTAYHNLLREFPEITHPSGSERISSHSIIHHTKTTPGPPIYCTPRRFAPDKLKIAIEEFDTMQKNGTARPSNRSSALYLAPKKKNGWRPCGDYRRLNARTVPETLDLKRTFNLVPVADTMSRIETIAQPVDLTTIAEAQRSDPTTPTQLKVTRTGRTVRFLDYRP